MSPLSQESEGVEFGWDSFPFWGIPVDQRSDAGSDHQWVQRGTIFTRLWTNSWINEGQTRHLTVGRFHTGGISRPL